MSRPAMSPNTWRVCGLTARLPWVRTRLVSSIPLERTARRLRSVTKPKTKNKKNMQTPYFRTYSRRALFDLPKLCMVVQLVVPIRKGVNHFIDPVYSFPASGQNADFWPLGKFKYRLTPLRGVLPVNEWMNEIGKTHGNTVLLPLFTAFR